MVEENVVERFYQLLNNDSISIEKIIEVYNDLREEGGIFDLRLMRDGYKQIIFNFELVELLLDLKNKILMKDEENRKAIYLDLNDFSISILEKIYNKIA